MLAFILLICILTTTYLHVPNALVNGIVYTLLLEALTLILTLR